MRISEGLDCRKLNQEGLAVKDKVISCLEVKVF